MKFDGFCSFSLSPSPFSCNLGQKEGVSLLLGIGRRKGRECPSLPPPLRFWSHFQELQESSRKKQPTWKKTEGKRRRVLKAFLSRPLLLVMVTFLKGGTGGRVGLRIGEFSWGREEGKLKLGETKGRTKDLAASTTKLPLTLSKEDSLSTRGTSIDYHLILKKTFLETDYDLLFRLFPIQGD